jgi:hypothetical protein
LPRLKADVRISVKVRGKPCRKIERLRQSFGRRYWIRVDGRTSVKLAEGTPTQIADRLHRWIPAV